MKVAAVFLLIFFTTRQLKATPIKIRGGGAANIGHEARRCRGRGQWSSRLYHNRIRCRQGQTPSRNRGPGGMAVGDNFVDYNDNEGSGGELYDDQEAPCIGICYLQKMQREAAQRAQQDHQDSAQRAQHDHQDLERQHPQRSQEDIETDGQHEEINENYSRDDSEADEEIIEQKPQQRKPCVGICYLKKLQLEEARKARQQQNQEVERQQQQNQKVHRQQQQNQEVLRQQQQNQEEQGQVENKISGCNDIANGLSCCDNGYTEGDNIGEKGEIFIQEFELFLDLPHPCQDTCKTLQPDSTGITESVNEQYKNGRNKCWCEFGEPKLDETRTAYKTCTF